MHKLPAIEIARACHEVNRAICQALGDESQAPWEEAGDEVQASALSGVGAVLESPNITPADLHESWATHKRAQGWVYGAVKDGTMRTHPCLLPYDLLPEGARIKDHAFRAVVNALSVGRTP